jgi:hypothetical protein
MGEEKQVHAFQVQLANREPLKIIIRRRVITQGNDITKKGELSFDMTLHARKKLGLRASTYLDLCRSMLWRVAAVAFRRVYLT